MKNAVESMNRMDQAEEGICELECWAFEIIQLENKGKRIKTEESQHDLCDTIKRNNLQITGVPEEEREKE